MELILLEKIQKLGDLGDKVNVKPGYGRNYLVPSGKAVPATAKNEVIMGEGPIRMVGEYDVLIHLHADVETTVKLIITPE